ncbi:dipicolinate synthase subunit A [Lachnospiraceae bacterium XBB1006]|nr:dipicolinate synthase subunit A [Lachnospiraceae bacterium XBB1006]
MTLPYIPVIGDDCRLPYLALELEKKGYDAHHFTGFFNDIPPFSVLVLGIRPTPASLKQLLTQAHSGTLICAGLPTKELQQMAEANHLPIFDYMKDPSVAIQNGVLTAEGALAMILTHSPLTIQSSRILILGYGRCGEPLSQKCRLLGAQVTIFDHAPQALARANAHGFCTLTTIPNLSGYDTIINTVPYLLLTAEHLATASPQVQIFDIASAPGGTDFSCCKKLNLSAMLCPALPARFAPQAAGAILADSIDAYLQKSKHLF